MRIPKLSRHTTGQAYARHKGRSYYFGPFGTASAEQRYRAWAAAIVAGVPISRNDAPAITFAELSEQYLEFARGRYKSRQVAKLRTVVDLCLPLYGETLASQFGPSKLRTVRELMVAKGYHPNTTNQRIAILRKLFRWAVSWELVPAGVGHALREVEGLRAPAPEARPAPESDIEAALPFMTAVVSAMVRVQLLTGMRPGEVVSLNSGEIAREDPAPGLWCYRPVLHKCAHHGLRREVLIGPRAQALLAPWLLLSPLGPIFRPLAARRTSSGAETYRAGVYTVLSYGRAIERACRAADVPTWSPGRLRHNAATRLEAEFGPRIAQIILGHTTMATTRRYVKTDLVGAGEAIRMVG